MFILCGCRGQRHVETTETQQYTSEIGVEFHELARFWNSMAEKLNYKIEFYPSEYVPGKPASDSTCPADPPTTMPANIQFPPKGVSAGVGGMGAVKSIEIYAERTEDMSVITGTDSVLEQKTAAESTLQKEKASEVRQDNGTWAIVSVVAAVALLLFIFIIIRTHRKK